MIWLLCFAMRAMMPRTETLPGIADTDIEGFLRRMRRESEGIYWLGMIAGAVLFTITPLVTIGLPVPAFFLRGRLLERHTDRVLSHRLYLLRQGVFLLRFSAGMCWGADPNVRAAFALPPYPVDPGTFRTS